AGPGSRRRSLLGRARRWGDHGGGGRRSPGVAAGVRGPAGGLRASPRLRGTRAGGGPAGARVRGARAGLLDLLGERVLVRIQLGGGSLGASLPVESLPNCRVPHGPGVVPGPVVSSGSGMPRPLLRAFLTG